VAFFPFQRTTLGVGRAVGLGISDCQGIVHRPGFTWDARELLGACGLSVWEFDHLTAGQEPFATGATGSYASPVIDVDQGYDAFLADLRARSPKFTRSTLAKERKLDRDAGEVRYVHNERDPRMLRTLMAWKSAQYRRTGRSDRFARRWIVDLVERLFHSRSDSFAGLLSVLYAGDRPVAAHFGLRSQQVLACWFPVYDPAFAKFSPGLVLHLRMAEGAAAEGVAHLDLGRGEKEYKDSLKTHELTVHEGRVTRRHPVALGHRARRAPVRALRNTVVTRPRLFVPADRLLKRIGSFRSGGR
jgi:CelD/BcsL family acetyltransferase involved in cellulose biosynthesis